MLKKKFMRFIGGAIVLLVMMVTGCGDTATDETTADVVTATDVTANDVAKPTSEPAADPAPTSVPDPTTEPEPTVAPTAETEPTPEPEPDPEPAAEPEADPIEPGEPLVGTEPGALDITALPALVETRALTFREPSADPLTTAVELIGFPLDMNSPVPGVLLNVQADVSFDDSSGMNEVDWYYQVEVDTLGELGLDDEDDPTGEAVDVMLDAALPRWVATGLEPQNTTSTPSDSHPSGVGSLQVYYRPTDAVPITAGGHDGSIATVGVFLQTDLDIDDAVDGETEQPGYRMDVDGVFEANDIPIPALAAIVEAIAIPEPLQLESARLSSSFDDDGEGASHGTPNLQVRMYYEAPAADFDAVVAALAAPTNPEVLVYGEPGVDLELVPEDLKVGTTASADLVLLNQYLGRMSMWAPDEGDETIELRVDFTLSINDRPLGPAELVDE